MHGMLRPRQTARLQCALSELSRGARITSSRLSGCLSGLALEKQGGTLRNMMRKSVNHCQCSRSGREISSDALQPSQVGANCRCTWTHGILFRLRWQHPWLLVSAPCRSGRTQHWDHSIPGAMSSSRLRQTHRDGPIRLAEHSTLAKFAPPRFLTSTHPA